MNKKSGLADSPLFLEPAKTHQAGNNPSSKSIQIKHENIAPSHHDTMASRHRDTAIPRHHAIETVRKSVKELGKDAATHRFTSKEKQAVAEIIFAYRKQGIKTSENEVTRIALNYLIEDYQEKGSNSILAQVLMELNT